MSRQVMLELPDEVADRADRLASIASRGVTDVLADAVSVVLPPLDVATGRLRPVSELSDKDVLQLADLRLGPAQDRRLSRLLDKQQAGTLAESERRELLALMQVYEVNLLRQASALAEAVRRGLREPLSR